MKSRGLALPEVGIVVFLSLLADPSNLFGVPPIRLVLKFYPDFLMDDDGTTTSSTTVGVAGTNVLAFYVFQKSLLLD